MQSHFKNMPACCQLLTDILESRKDVVHLSNPYQKCPVYETSSFLLRLVQLDDAKDLLACYSDRRSVANMNADCCTSNFYYETLTQMQECIRFWLREYQQQAYIRFAIIDKTVKKAVGTAEIFGGTLGGGLSGFGVLRIDLALPYETAPLLNEIVSLAANRWTPDFAIPILYTKAGHTKARVPVLEKHGFTASDTFRPGMGYYEKQQI